MVEHGARRSRVPRTVATALVGLALVGFALPGFASSAPGSAAEAAPTTTPLGIGPFRQIEVEPTSGEVVVAGDGGIVVLDAVGDPLRSIERPGTAGFAIEGDDLWVSRPSAAVIERLDLDSLEVEATFPVGTVMNGSLIVVAGQVWFMADVVSRYWDVFRLDPATGEVTDHGGRVYGGRLVEIPGVTDEVLVHDSGLSPYSVRRTDVTGEQVDVVDRVRHGVGSNLADVVVTEHGTFLTASGSPYRFHEFTLADMEETETVYEGTHYPRGVAYAPGGGGTVAGITGSTEQVFVHHEGEPGAVLRFSAGGEVLDRGVALAPDASAVYLVTADSVLRRFPLGPELESPSPSVVEHGVAADVTVRGQRVVDVTAVLLDGEPVDFEVAEQLVVHLPDGLELGEHTITVTTPFGTTDVVVLVALRPAAPPAPTAVAGAGSATVTVVAPDDGGAPITGYEVRSSVDGVGCSAGVGRSCVVEGLEDGVAHRFSARARNGAGEGAWSSWSDEVVPYDVPGEPPHPDVEVGPHQAVVLLEAPEHDGGSPVTGFEVQAHRSGGTCTRPDPGPCTVTGLPPGTPESFRARALNARGPGPWTAWTLQVLPGCAAGDQPFSDVGGGHPFCSEVSWLADGGLSTGYADGTFRPGARVTRMALAALLFRHAAPEDFAPPAFPSFLDVPDDHPFYAAIEWLAAEGIARGYVDGTFRPSAPITRQSFAAMIYRLQDPPGFEAPSPSFSDVAEGSPFFLEVEWLADLGIATGYADGTFRPAAPLTRQAMAALLARWSIATAGW